VEEGGRLSIAARDRAISFTTTAGDRAGDPGKIFTPFLTTKTKGTGLGLAIAHKIVEAHGGTIEAKNGPEAERRSRSGYETRSWSSTTRRS
jgi:nitrogen fixation/metabolism regulation signal transduction histidine kinase